MRQKRSKTKKRTYGDKVRQGLCPYKYPFATGSAAMKQRESHSYKFVSPPAAKASYLQENNEYDKPSRRRA